jgi:hypothetical protein
VLVAALIALAHIAGAVIVLIACWVGMYMIANWDGERCRKAGRYEASIALGIPVEELDTTENESKMYQYAAARFSSDLLRNRLSDLCGWMQVAWGCLGALLQVCALLAVIWYMGFPRIPGHYPKHSLAFSN